MLANYNKLTSLIATKVSAKLSTSICSVTGESATIHASIRINFTYLLLDEKSVINLSVMA